MIRRETYQMQGMMDTGQLTECVQTNPLLDFHEDKERTVLYNI